MKWFPVAILSSILVSSVALAQDKSSMAVMPLVPQRIDAEITTVLDELLVTEVYDKADYKVIGASDINAMLGLDKMKSALGCDDVSCAAELGGALGVDVLLSGTVARLGDELIITLKLIDIHKTEIKERVTLRIPDRETGYAAGISNAVRRLFGASAATGSPDPEPTEDPMAPPPEPAPEPEPVDPAEDPGSHFTLALQAGLGVYLDTFEPNPRESDGTLRGSPAPNEVIGPAVRGYVGYHFDLGLIVEAAVGYDLRDYEGGDGIGTVEHLVILAGARYELMDGPAIPWVGGHIGTSVLMTDFNVTGDDQTFAQLGFDAGAGFNYAFGDHFELGAGLWFNFAQQSTGEHAYTSNSLRADSSINPAESNPVDPGMYVTATMEVRVNL